MAEGFRFIPLGLVGLRAFRLGAWVSWVQRWKRCSCACAQSGRVTQRYHNSPRWETGLHNASDFTHRKCAEDLGRFWKSQLVECRHWKSWDETSLGGRRLVFACSRRLLWRVPHVLGGCRWKSQNRKNVYLSFLCRNL